MIGTDDPFDSRILARLWEFAASALQAQDPAVRDQLDAAIRDGRITFGVEGAVATVTIDGNAVCVVTLEALLGDEPPDELHISTDVEPLP